MYCSFGHSPAIKPSDVFVSGLQQPSMNINGYKSIQ